MTNQVALKWLNEAEILDLTCGNNKDRQVINLAIEALKKQIPSGVRFNGDDAVCPKCGSSADWKKYCDECGQRLCDEERD